MSVVSVVTFFVLLTLIVAAANVYAFRWAVKTFPVSPRLRRALAVVLAASIVGVIAGRIADRVWSEAPVGGLIAVASTLQLAVFISVVLLLGVDAFRLLSWLSARGLSRLGSRRVSAVSEDVPLPSSEVPRRAFLTQAAAGSAFLIGSSSSLYGALAGRHDYAIEEVPLRVPGLARAFDGFVIVQLSDIHIGPFVGEAELAAGEELVRQARPDLIVLTGDLIDHDARLAPRLGGFVRRLSPLAREGVVAISGNHDFYAGITPTTLALSAGGATVLRNRGRIIGDRQAGFALLGVDDVWAARAGRGGGPDLQAAVRSLPKLAGSLAAARDLPRILLCHNPSYFEHAAGQVDLQLSGHTHGGQINLVVRPADWVLRNGWVAGLYERSRSKLYVNRGFGTVGPPARVGAPPEITRIVLTA